MLSMWCDDRRQKWVKGSQRTIPATLLYLVSSPVFQLHLPLSTAESLQPPAESKSYLGLLYTHTQAYQYTKGFNAIELNPSWSLYQGRACSAELYCSRTPYEYVTHSSRQ